MHEKKYSPRNNKHLSQEFPEHALYSKLREADPGVWGVPSETQTIYNKLFKYESMQRNT